MVHNMAWWAWNAIWYGPAIILWYMVWPGVVYDMIWRAKHGIWYGLTGMAWYMKWPDGMPCYMV